ncbi:hypothetical protein FRC96_03220 [Lujinxingia vulgaris]|uniref:Uncharacterized protein n=1 Tax=Lujinxingia vulgaris TaxID=2600176 RepID=A0A5C6XEG7_9DELT|nr:hypothetical protein [Lujinxingia vulgaris]TXD42691.1 hypothetical protein FRC96_03220 [Lujinxingia vulgaris]
MAFTIEGDDHATLITLLRRGVGDLDLGRFTILARGALAEDVLGLIDEDDLTAVGALLAGGFGAADGEAILGGFRAAASRGGGEQEGDEGDER